MSANDQKIPSDTPCPGVGEARSQLATGSFHPGMMGGGSFIPLKVDCWRRESAKQPEIRLATLLKVLRIPRSEAGKRRHGRVMAASNAAFLLDMANPSYSPDGAWEVGERGVKR